MRRRAWAALAVSGWRRCRTRDDPHFRHLLERHGLGKVVFASTKEHRAEQGLMLKKGTVMDGSILAAPTWRKNRRGEGDLEMEQSKKGNQWHFGMKLPMGGENFASCAPASVASSKSSSRPRRRWRAAETSKPLDEEEADRRAVPPFAGTGSRPTGGVGSVRRGGG